MRTPSTRASHATQIGEGSSPFRSLYIYIYIYRERERERERERRLAKVDEGSQNSPWDMYGLKHYNQVSYEIPVGVELVLEFWGRE